MTKLSSKPNQNGDDEPEVAYEKFDDMASRLDVLTQRVAHVEQRLESLTKQVAAIESRVHEDVE